MDKTIEALLQFTSNWNYKIELGKKLNTPLNVGFSDAETESLTCLEMGLFGTGTISHGNDHSDGSETKALNKVQPKDCEVCKKKHNFFTEICSCGSDKFTSHTDARWGIDTKAHFEYNVPNYYLWLLRPESQNETCKKFYLEFYEIDSENEHFKNILEGQYRSPKSKNKNFMPFGVDFYSSGPKMKAYFEITLSETNVNVTRLEIREIFYTKEILEIMKSVFDISFVIEKDNYLYEEIKPFIDVKRKKRAYGKERGKTKRRNQ